ncbi:MAG: hypothetical protein COT71_03110 [Candidatus Andersenbacteria bacterium CG10_big_fil_rev_8_21_14_0_10_54_11]|uniref:Thymidylate kinase n=1 Tax=Candidatus Andersenbacteria bacterium CG10_big_fil_rev_8_21_14_0_10_54_11 TaxID=1974485 RepID=A0A2M6WYV7_9BACT|nr:MAG: hypothetical protein COT71_03110 [Candidatus Andersenbacteria bacterium CG10_big_fil_rev_8_21_14_0_10_54_11]
MKGLLISFDGLDASGKATQTRLLIERLRSQNLTVHTFGTPDYTTPTGQELRAYLQGKLDDWSAMPWQKKMRLFADNRAEHRQEVVAALAAGEIVVYDRYVPSSLTFITVEAKHQEAYRSRQEIHAEVRQAEYHANNMPQEDISIFLDVPPRLALTLLGDRKKQQQEPEEYTDQLAVQEELYREYEHLISTGPNRYTRVMCVDQESLLPPEVIAGRVWQMLTNRFPQLPILPS